MSAQWTVDPFAPHRIIGPAAEGHPTIATANTKELAALIVEAVNSHAALTERVRELERSLKTLVGNAERVDHDYYGLAGHEDFNVEAELDTARALLTKEAKQ